MSVRRSSCCCPDIKRVITGFGVFSTVTSVMQILVTVAVITGFLQIGVFPKNFTPTSPASYLYIFYITLSSADFFVILFGLIMLCGNECTDERRTKCYCYPWLLLIPFYIGYESAINILYFIQAFNVNTAPSVPLGFTIVPLVYWAVKDFILFIGFILIAMYVCPCQRQYVEKMVYIQQQPQVQTFTRPSVTVTGPSYYAAGPLRAPSPPACNGACYRQGGRSCQSCQYSGRGGNVKPVYGYSPQNTGGGQFSSSVYQAAGRRPY